MLVQAKQWKYQEYYFQCEECFNYEFKEQTTKYLGKLVSSGVQFHNVAFKISLRQDNTNKRC